ncbi:DUF6916 family protein [Thalassotalea atypica]|uniref:DUF6916 family protein n=1 Tax=Thalassotalea atypica TaxID=2054316 RepID=UPI0025731B66|nr:hypothetical protein [Thalassotalea atypica]
MSKMDLVDLSDIQMTDFSNIVNQPFRCLAPIEGEIELTEVVALNKQDDSRAKKAPFILVFHAPLEFPIQQDTYHLSHQELGTMAIFLVPVGKSEESVIFEATFT